MADLKSEIEAKKLELLGEGVIKNAWEATPNEIGSAKQIITVKDLIGKTYSSGAINLQEMKGTLTTLSNSYITQSSVEIAKYVEVTKTAITSLESYNNVINTYRKVKPLVKTAVNIGGLVWNFANAGEMSQDVLQYILTKAQAEVLNKVSTEWESFMNTPILIVLGEGTEDVVETYNEVYDACKEIVNDYLLDLSTNMEEFLKLVRKMNDSLIKQETEFTVKNFVEFANIFVYDAIYYNDYTYLATKNNGIIKIKGSTEETILNVEARNLYFTDDGLLYYTIFDNTDTKLFISTNTETSIITAQGSPLGITKFDEKIILVTNKNISSPTRIVASATGFINTFAKFDNKLFFSEGNKVYHLENTTLPKEEGLEADSIVKSMVVFKSELIIASSNGTEIKIGTYETQPKFIKANSDNYGYTFIKKIGNIIYATKNKTMYKITESEDSITSEIFLTNLPEEISGFVIVSIDSINYYIIASKEMIFVSLDTKWWDEKIVDVEAVGLGPGLITDLYYDGTDIYVSVLKSVVKITSSNFGLLKPTSTIITPETLSPNIVVASENPTGNSIDKIIDIVPVSKIKEYADYVYKIHHKTANEITVSSGNKIIKTTISTGVTVSERVFNSRLYLSQITENGVFYTDGTKLYFEDVLIKTVNENNTLLSMFFHASTGTGDFNRTILFSKSTCFVETTNSEFIIPIPIKINIYGENVFIKTDSYSLLASDGRNIIKASNTTDGFFEYIQSISNTVNVFINENVSFIQTQDNVLYKSSDYNITYKNATYHNGYEHKSFYSNGVGVAPYDYSSSIFLNTRTPKKKYIDFMKPSFIDNFKSLIKELPNVIIKEVMEKISNKKLISTNDNDTKKEVIKILKERVEKEINKLLTESLYSTFSKNTELEEGFAVALIEKLNQTGRYDFTVEFYNIAFEVVAELISKVIELINQISEDAYASYALWYYNEHKEEWNDDIVSKITGNYVAFNKYSIILNPCRRIELDVLRDVDLQVNTDCINQINIIKEEKTGNISLVDKNSLKEIILNQSLNKIENSTEYEEWAEPIKTVITTIYKVQQQNQYEDIVNESNMNPIQWDTLPKFINKDKFSTELEIILEGRRRLIIEAINVLVGLGQVNCFSCVTEASAVSLVRKEINKVFKMIRSSAHNKIINSTTYENLPSGFYIYDGFGANVSLPTILNKQSDLYVEYLSKAIDIIINEIKYLITEEEE